MPALILVLLIFDMRIAVVEEVCFVGLKKVMKLGAAINVQSSNSASIIVSAGQMSLILSISWML